MCDIVPAGPGDRFLSMLPPWHAYERACEYFIRSLEIVNIPFMLQGEIWSKNLSLPTILIAICNKGQFGKTNCPISC